MASGLENIETVESPFRRFVTTIGVFPTAFTDAMTYYECLAYLVKYMEETLIPAINENAEAVKELQELYIQLKAFVDNYFDNLDVQEEINNKLDQMAEDGTLQEIMAQYITSKVDWCFNSVYEMKASENLVDGSYAHTYGYYDVDDRGESFYYITNTEPSSYYEVLNNGLYAQLIHQPIMNVEQYGAVGDGTTDDSTFISHCIDDARDGEVINFTNTYKVTSGFNITKNITLEGNGTILPFDGEDSYRVFNIVADNVSIKNITIDGTNSTQDKFAENNYSSLKLITAIRATAKQVQITNSVIKNLYGNGIQLFGYKNIGIENLIITDVGGHWYQNNAYDSFGDGIYFGGTEGESHIVLTNIDLTGKYKNNTLSRCGLCFENLGSQTDTVTNVIINDAKLTKYDRVIHTEGNDGNVIINGKMMTLNGNCIYCYGSQPSKMQLNLDNADISFTGNDYNGTRGFRCVQFYITNSLLSGSTAQALANFYSTGTFNRCNITNINNTLFNSGGNVTMEECNLTFNGITAYLIYNTAVTFKKCKFTSPTNLSANRSGSNPSVYECEFVNYLPYCTFKDTKSIIKMDDGFTLTTSQKYLYQATSFVINNVDMFYPNMAGTIAVDDINKYALQSYRTIPSGTSIAFQPTISQKLRINAKYALVTVGTNDWVHIANARNFDGVYLNIITTDSNGDINNIGATSTIGTVATSRALNIDVANNTVSQAGTYANVIIQYVLDINDINNIANYS